jgi:peroxiredoxin Q/BCP
MLWYQLSFIICMLSIRCFALDFGDDAPDFTLFDQEGYTHTLKEHRGQFVLLFFYPRDFNFHSAQLAKSFESKYSELKGKNVVIYGVSNDFMKTHLDFHTKMNLTYDLLSDPDEEVIKKYKAKGLLGGKFISYLIGPDGRIFKRYQDNLSVKHPLRALHDLD